MFFNAKQNEDGTYDRVYEATDFAEYFADFIGNGVYNKGTTPLQVVSKNGLTVKVKAGTAFIDGHKYELTEDKDITLSPNTYGTEKQSVIAVTLNLTNREITVKARQNVTSLLPVSSGGTKELVLASIKMSPNASNISQSDITDRRPDSSYCGWVTGVVKQIDTTDLFAQFEDAFNTWFDGVKNQLTTDAAGKLQAQINSLTKESYFYKDLSGASITAGLGIETGYVGVRMIGNVCTIFGQFKTNDLASGRAPRFVLASSNDIRTIDSGLLSAMSFHYKTSNANSADRTPYVPTVVYEAMGTTYNYYPARISLDTGIDIRMSGDFVENKRYEFYVTYICKGKTS